jgi:hypothetical protein
LTAGGADKLKEFWDEEGSDQEPKGRSQKFWNPGWPEILVPWFSRLAV